MNQDQQAITKITNKVVGQKVSAIELDGGSGLNIDFGKIYAEVIICKDGKKREYISGEWRLWVYMCAWRIDRDDRPYVASSDDHTKIEALIKELVHTTLTKCEILNASLDIKYYFNDHITLTLFNWNTEDEAEEQEQWMLFTPGEMVLTIGPGDTWTYKPSNAI